MPISVSSVWMPSALIHPDAAITKEVNSSSCCFCEDTSSESLGAVLRGPPTPAPLVAAILERGAVRFELGPHPAVVG